MLKYASLLAPLLMRNGTPNPVRVFTGYVGAMFLSVFAAIFFLAALFVWIATNYGLDVAFLTVALILTVGAIGLTIMARVSQTVKLKTEADRHERIQAMLAAKSDPLADHIPDEWLTHPASQKILAQIEDKPFVAAAAAAGLGLALSSKIVSGDLIGDALG